MMNQADKTVPVAAQSRPDKIEQLEHELNALAARARRAGFVEAGHFIGVAVASIEESRRSEAA